MEKTMNIDFKPAVRFLKKVVDKGAEIGKNIAYAKHHPLAVSAYVVTIAAATVVCPPPARPIFGVVMTGVAACFLNTAGKFNRLRDENAASAQPSASALSL
jgi:hypothetical protein